MNIDIVAKFIILSEFQVSSRVFYLHAFTKSPMELRKIFGREFCEQER